jgi:hypothetical protein
MPRKKKQREPEYTLHVFHHHDERTRRELQVFLVRTVKEFTSFGYEILLDAVQRDRLIQLKVLGLRTTPLIMPGVGPASGRRDFANLQGLYNLSVIKLNGETNDFQLDVTSSQISISGNPAHPFIIVSNTPVPQPAS